MPMSTACPSPIPREQALTPQVFAREYVSRGRPVVLLNAMEGWSAAQWTPEMFAQRFGDRKLIVGFGKQWRKLSMAAMVRVVQTSPVPTRRLGPSLYTLYLRNRHMGTDFPELLNDFEISSHFEPNWLAQWPLSKSFPFSSKELVEFFMGPPGAMGPTIHQDAYLTHAWISQIYGTKRVWMVSPQCKGNMYPDPAKKTHSLLIDLEFPDEKFSEFDPTEVASVLLSPGETIFIPSGWWHTAECVTASISLSGNFANSTNFSDVSRLFTLPRFQKCKHPRLGQLLNRVALTMHGSACRLRQL